MPVEMSAASADSLIRAETSFLRDLEVNGFNSSNSNLICSNQGRTLFSADIISLVSADLEVVPERDSKS